MKRRTIISILILLNIGGAAWVVPYDFAGHCAKSGSGDIAICFFRNAGVMVLRVVPLLLAVIVAIGLIVAKPKPPTWRDS